MKNRIKLSFLVIFLLGFHYTYSTTEQEFDNLIKTIKSENIAPDQSNLTPETLLKAVQKAIQIEPETFDRNKYGIGDMAKAMIAASTDSKINQIPEKYEFLDSQTFLLYYQNRPKSMSEQFNQAVNTFKNQFSKLYNQAAEFYDEAYETTQNTFSEFSEPYDQLKQNFKNTYQTSQNQLSELYYEPSFTSLGNVLVDPMIASGIAISSLGLGYAYYLYKKNLEEKATLQAKAHKEKENSK